MTITAKFIPDSSVIEGTGEPDARGYYNVDFEFLDLVELTETDPPQVVCSYSLTVDETILNDRFRYAYSYDGSNATAEAAETALAEYLQTMYLAAGGDE